MHFQGTIGTSYYKWRLVVPGGQAVSLLHFSAQRSQNDTAAAEAQAQALASLTDPNALAGLTAAELLRIVNFKIP